MKYFERIEELATKLGWNVRKDEEYVIFQKHSTAGQDFSVELKVEDVYDIKSKLEEAHEDYDVSEEAYLWLDDTGHGRDGAPYEMIDVYRDMEECKGLLEELSIAIGELVDSIEEESI